MKAIRDLGLLLVASAGGLACGDPATTNPIGPLATGGSAGVTTSVGGASGGSVPLGGTPGTGGTISVQGGNTGQVGGTGPAAGGGMTSTGGMAGATMTTGGVAGAGAPSTGGTGGQGGSTGTGGAAGAAGSTGTGGSVATGNCTFNVDPSLSTAIPTVGIVDWSTDMANPTSAQIAFRLVGAMADETNTGGVAPVTLTGSPFHTLLLGMKAQRDYAFNITVSDGAMSCTSEDFMLTTGALANSLPTIQTQVPNAAAQSHGFIITSAGIGGFGGGGMGGDGAFAYIFDTDGDIVWWAAAPQSCSRALMNYEGTEMWMEELNVDNGGGEMRRVSMDGLDAENNVQGLSDTHHDFTVLPGGIVAAPSWISGGNDPPSDLIERSPDGTIKTVVRIDSNIYQSNTFHANAIHYRPSDDTYTIGDRNPNLFVKISHQGQLLWQFGGNCSNSPATKCAGGNWQVNHGHQLLDDGHFVFFNNGAGGGSQSTAYEYELIESDSSLTANQVWSYQANGVSSMVLGDVERLPNGNNLVVFSNSGAMHEVDSASKLVASYSASSFGYGEFRESLYGPPLR